MRHSNLFPLIINLKPRLHDTTGCQTGCQTGLTTGLTAVLNEERCSFNTVVKPGCTTGLTTGCIHDTTGCQTGLTTGLTTGCIVYANIYPVVNPVWQPVSQQVVSCKRGLTEQSSTSNAAIRWITLSIRPFGVAFAWPIMGKHDVIHKTGST